MVEGVKHRSTVQTARVTNGNLPSLPFAFPSHKPVGNVNASHIHYNRNLSKGHNISGFPKSRSGEWRHSRCGRTTSHFHSQGFKYWVTEMGKYITASCSVVKCLPNKLQWLKRSVWEDDMGVDECDDSVELFNYQTYSICCRCEHEQTKSRILQKLKAVTRLLWMPLVVTLCFGANSPSHGSKIKCFFPREIKNDILWHCVPQEYCASFLVCVSNSSVSPRV